MALESSQTKQKTAIRENAPSPFALQQALNEWGRNSFKYGSVDCCQFTAFIVYKMTGKNYADGLEYESELGADALIAKYGDLVGVLTRAIGEPPNEAKSDGDPCVVDVFAFSCATHGTMSLTMRLASSCVWVTER